MRRGAHVLLAAGDHDVGVAAGDGLRASITAFRPEPQTLLMVIAGTMSGRPALIAAWRAGFWPDAGGQHLAQDDFGDLVGLDARALRAAS